MWVLIALQLMAGSGTARNSFPIVFSGITTSEFSTKESCEEAKNTINMMNSMRNRNSELAFEIRNGIIELKCVPKWNYLIFKIKY